MTEGHHRHPVFLGARIANWKTGALQRTSGEADVRRLALELIRRQALINHRIPHKLKAVDNPCVIGTPRVRPAASDPENPNSKLSQMMRFQRDNGMPLVDPPR